MSTNGGWLKKFYYTQSLEINVGIKRIRQLYVYENGMVSKIYFYMKKIKVQDMCICVDCIHIYEV